MSHRASPAWSQRFTDPALFEREQERLGAAWTLLAFTGELARDGDWLRTTLGGRSIFVQRFGDELRGFENVCAHRFFPLRTAERGNGPIRCGFHHWQYNKEGAAAGIPKCKEMFGCGPREVGARLRRVEVATCGALLFGRFGDADGEAGGDLSARGSGRESLEQYLGPGFPILRAMTNVPRVPRCMRTALAANWKLGYHISLDDYHLVAVHPDTFGKGGYLDADVVRYYRFGSHSAYFHTGRDGDLAAMAAACEGGSYRPDAYRVFQFFPNLLVSHVPIPGGCYGIVQQYRALAVDRTELRTWLFPAPFPPADQGARAALARRLLGPLLPLVVPRRTRKIVGEDNAVCEQLQTVAAQARGEPHFARHEERIAWFTETYDAWLSGEAIPGASAP
ncbi:MAG TPA: Rieske 2Fe-2S domain-containing protein [Gemmatimonadaceae bacterium]|jgi:phenylpropionate dioxygenase-like ring-hydroxylating dioxygenase large terminal subunit|nr:Rieske 2Fe-2S domain-containing protein [Gemmatimonadaceae bacterium]